MRPCEEIEILMNLYLDDMLTSEEQQALKAHLESCPQCRARMEELCTLKTVLGQMEEPVPADLHERILTFVEEQTREKKTIPFYRKGWYRTLAGVAACAVLMVVAARFAPNLDMSVKENGANNTGALNAPMAPPGMMEAATAMPESVQDSYVPGNDIVPAPQTPSASPEFSAAGTPEMQPATNAVTGQLSEDLPPLRKDTVDENDDYHVPTVRKWLKVVGTPDALPNWVDRHYIYEAELDGVSREYVEIAEWAEEYWVDQLTACGFTIEVMEDREIMENGEHILLVFFWE